MAKKSYAFEHSISGPLKDVEESFLYSYYWGIIFIIKERHHHPSSQFPPALFATNTLKLSAFQSGGLLLDDYEGENKLSVARTHRPKNVSSEENLHQ